MRAGVVIILLLLSPVALYADLEPEGVESSHLWSEVDWLGTLHEKAPAGQDGIVVFQYAGVLPEREVLKYSHIDPDAKGFFAVKRSDGEVYFVLHHDSKGERCVLRAAGQIEKILQVDGVRVPLVSLNSPQSSATCYLSDR